MSVVLEWVARAFKGGRQAEVRSRNAFMTLAGLVCLAVVLLVAMPLAGTFASLFVSEGSLDFSSVAEAAQQRGVLVVIRNTAIVVLGSVVLAVVIGSFFAWLSERSDAGMGWVSNAFPILPLLVPPIAGSVGWAILLSPQAGYLNVAIRKSLEPFGVTLNEGPLNVFSWYGLILVYTLYLVPHVFLTVAAALRTTDPALEEASRVGGASPFRTVLKVTLPAIKPAIGTGAMLALVFGFALFSVPSIIGTRAGIEVLTVRIVRLIRMYPPQTETALALGMIVVAVMSIGMFWQIRLRRAARHATIGGRGTRTQRVELGFWRWPARGVILAYLGVTTVLPFGALLIASTQAFWSARIDFAGASLENYRDLLGSQSMTRSALTNSLALAVLGATISVLLMAIIVTYTHRRWRTLLSKATEAATKLPGAVSNIVIGLALLVAFGGPPFRLSGSLLLLFIAYLVITMPQSSLTASAAYTQIGNELTEASFVSGAGERRTFLRVSLPLMVPGLTAGWAVVFVLIVGDITASAILAGVGNPVVGFAVLELWDFGTYPLMAALATTLSLISSVIVLSTLAVSRRNFSR